jgi:hypothetical protein
MSTLPKTILNNIEIEKTNRSMLSDRWVELWSLYRTDPLKLAKEDGWQSRLNDGRVFEVVETVASYLRSALFFSDNWVNLEATEPELGEILPIVNVYFRNCLNKSNLKREFRIFLRQLLLLGFSGMSVEWCDDGLSFSTINSYDFYIESTRRLDENSFAFRDIYLNYSSFMDYVDDGWLDVADPEKFWEKHKTNFSDTQAEWRSLGDTAVDSSTSHIVLTEYWCPTEETLYRIIDEEIVGEEESECCPWFVCSLYELPDIAYGLSHLDSSIGLILESNAIRNRRLDNMAVSVDNMWLFIDDGVTNPDDLKTEPGKILRVSRPDVLTPLYPPPNNFSITYEETARLDASIDRNTGTGALISSGQYRSGDRVTAEEINAVKDAGGNRLTDLYEHLESTFVIPLLYRSLDLLRKNAKQAIVRKTNSKGTYDYFKMLPEDLHKSYEICVTATQNVINRDRNIRRIQEFLTLVSSVPQFAQLINYTNLYVDLLNKFGFDNPERYLVDQSQEDAAPAPSTPMDALMQGAEQLGGEPEANALLANMQDGSLSGMMDIGTPQQTPPDPMAQAQSMQVLNTPL